MAVEFRVRMMNVLLLPLFVFAVAFEFGDEGVEGDGLVVGVGRGESEVGAEFETAVTVGRVVVGGVVEGGVGGEK